MTPQEVINTIREIIADAMPCTEKLYEIQDTLDEYTCTRDVEVEHVRGQE